MLSIGNKKLSLKNISNKYNHEVNNIMFSCLRSLLAYENPKFMTQYFMEKKLYKYLKGEKLKELVDIRMNPIFYNGPQIRKNRSDVQGYMIYSKKTLYITFRGSNDTQDLLACLDIRTENLEQNICIHKGYYSQFKAIEADITSDILRISNSFDIEKIVFSGHSLGGALATIAAPYYSNIFRGSKYIACHTFGSTAVGNENFVEWFKDNVNENYRVECEYDIIPLLPIHKHVPNNILLHEDFISNQEYDIKNYIDLYKFLNHTKHINFDNFVNLHSCKRYLDILYIIYCCSNISALDSQDYIYSMDTVEAVDNTDSERTDFEFMKFSNRILKFENSKRVSSLFPDLYN
jgi:hypothetical protein